MQTSLDTSSGLSVTVSGTPTKIGNYSFTLNLADQTTGEIFSRTFTVVISETQSEITAEAVGLQTPVSFGSLAASDNTDGNTITCSPASGSNFGLGTTFVTCNTKDLAGNTVSSKSFQVTVVDTTAPVITLNGSSTIKIAQGHTFTDPGATASDAVDGSVTVTAPGSVDTSTVGNYTITYNTTDASGNAADPVTRTVQVLVPTLDSISITTQATKTSYTVGDKLDLSGLVVTGHYTDDTTQVLPVNYGDVNKDGIVDLKDRDLVNAHDPSADINGDGTVDFQDLLVVISRMNQSDVTGFDSSVPATGQVLTITLGEKTTTYNVNIAAVPVPQSSSSGGGGSGYVSSSTSTLGNADLNHDGKVDILDFVILMANWGQTGSNVANINGDGQVDILDFVSLMANWTR